MHLVTRINDRDIYYLHASNLYELDKSSTYTCLVPVLNTSINDLNEIAEYIVKNDRVIYICSGGKFAQDVENSFDLANLYNDVLLVTTADKEIKEAIWFATYNAHDGYKDIEQVVCILLDKTEDTKNEIIEAISSVANGWEPAD